MQDQSFLLGAVLVTLVHATKFGELNLGNPVTGRYLALLPGAKVRDFVGPYAYQVALLAFLGVSLTAYYLACQLSPDILQGAAKLLGYVDADKTIQGVPYPLYVAALFIGLTQPIVPVFSRFGEAQRDFFHDQIEVPRRLIDLAERLASAVEARAAADKRLLAREVRNLVSGNVFSTVQTYGDLAFYKLQLERLDLGDPGALDNAIKESSAKELRGLIERIIFCTLVAVMRQSGTRALVKVADAIGVPSSRPRFSNFGYFVTGLAASGMLFSIQTDGTGFSSLYSFTGARDGASPNGGLVVSGDIMYGTAFYGGNTGFDARTAERDRWIRLSAPNGVSPANEFVVRVNGHLARDVERVADPRHVRVVRQRCRHAGRIHDLALHIRSPSTECI